MTISLSKFPTNSTFSAELLTLLFIYGDCGRLGNAPDCDSGICEFESHQSPKTKG